MVFSDLKFIYLFLPVFLLVYYLIKPLKLKNAFLFLASIAFYTFGTLERPYYTVLLVLAIVITYFSGILMQRFAKVKKLILVLSLLYNFGLLFLFKYEGFLVTAINTVFNTHIPVLELVLPVGISFYTFQAVSYTVDVYRSDIPAADNFIDYGAYLSMFPQLVAGPIVVYSDVQNELKKRDHSFALFEKGLKLFIWGLGYKVIIANNMGALFRDAVSAGFDSLSTPYAWLCAITYSFQLYFDFCGYSLMAKGMGKMMGFNIPDNFNNPYIAISFTDFWRRWHITLSSWFKNYVYIPLGGSRKGIVRTLINLLIVWLFTGLWHGADYNFLLWGLVTFFFISLEKLGLKSFLEKHKILGHAYMIILIPLTWSVFAITDLDQLMQFFTRLFPFFGTESLVKINIGDFLRQYGILLPAAVILSTPLDKLIYSKLENSVLGGIVLCGIFALSVYFLCIGLNDPFLYFRF